MNCFIKLETIDTNSVWIMPTMISMVEGTEGLPGCTVTVSYQHGNVTYRVTQTPDEVVNFIEEYMDSFGE